MICKSISMSGRLNAFQKVMLHWSELHPYNAVHVYKVAGPARCGQLNDAIDEAYWLNGIGAVELEGDGESYHFEPDESPEIEVVRGFADPDGALLGRVAGELNRPFGRPRCQPIRFTLIEAGPAAHYVVATYDHWMADAFAARLILRHVLGRYCGLEIPENREPVGLFSGTYRDAFADRLGTTKAATAAVRAAVQWLGSRSCSQAAYASTTQMEVGCQLRRVEADAVDRLRGFARSHGATVHDVVLAALGRAMAQFLPRRSKGKDLSLGTIVDTRGDAQADLSNSLGAFLGYYLVRSRHEPGASLADATERVAAATGPVKTGRRYLDSLVNMQLINTIWPHLSDATRPYFMRKVLPLTAGVSNVFLRDSWIDRYAEGKILEYSRFASTGPSVPLVLSPTTLGGKMSLGLSYRVTGFSRAKIDGILDAFLDQIEHPDGRVAAPRRPINGLSKRNSGTLRPSLPQVSATRLVAS